MGQEIHDAIRSNRVNFKDSKDCTVKRIPLAKIASAKPKFASKNKFDVLRCASVEEEQENVCFSYTIDLDADHWGAVIHHPVPINKGSYYKVEEVKFRKHPENYPIEKIIRSKKRSVILGSTAIDSERRRLEVIAQAKRSGNERKLRFVLDAYKFHRKRYSQYCRRDKLYSNMTWADWVDTRLYDTPTWERVKDLYKLTTPHRLGHPHLTNGYVYMQNENGERINPFLSPETRPP